MNVKIDTKEKFVVITLVEANLSANMTVEYTSLLTKQLQNVIPHVVLSMNKVEQISPEMAHATAKVQQLYYEQNFSFVVCCMNEPVQEIFVNEDLLDLLNYTPTESEAWDIVQMEEIERELMDDFE